MYIYVYKNAERILTDFKNYDTSMIFLVSLKINYFEKIP